MQDRYLITGASGFIGSNVVRELVKRGQLVNILTRNKKPSWRLSDIYERLRVFPCDLLDTKLEKIVDSVAPTVILHFAAYGVNPWETNLDRMVDTNIKGTSRLIQFAKKHAFRLFVNTGSSSEYGVKNHSMKETDYLEPVNDYGVVKAGVSLLCTKIAIRESLPIMTIRLFSPFGYYEHANRLFPSVIRAAISGKPITVSNAYHVRDFIFIEDVVSAYMRVTEKKCPPGAVVNIASGREHSVGDVVQSVMRETGSRSQVLWNAVKDQARQVEPRRWQADISKAVKLLGWKPRVSFREGIKKTVAWFERNNSLYE